MIFKGIKIDTTQKNCFFLIINLFCLNKKQIYCQIFNSIGYKNTFKFYSILAKETSYWNEKFKIGLVLKY